jgi:hypothetical protein
MGTLRARIERIKKRTQRPVSGAPLSLLSVDGGKTYHTPQGKTYSAGDLPILSKQFDLTVIVLPSNGRENSPDKRGAQ